MAAQHPPTPSLTRALVPCVLAVAAATYLARAFLSGGSPSRQAVAQNTTVLAWIGAPGQDGFYNFDFKSQSATSNNVDWPMRFLFRDNANINKIKNAIDGCGGDPTISPTTCSSGGAQYHRFQDYPNSAEWDGDGGKKQSNHCTNGAQHMRLYARSSTDKNHNSEWGYYVFASVHKDWEGGSGGSCTQYFSAEGEEGWWVLRILNNLPAWTVHSNSYWWSNPDSGHWDTYQGHQHWTESNGWAAYVWVP
ncbi:MAG: hypothetical protein ACKVVT_03360 [Dehalococcoidia bacterium]